MPKKLMETNVLLLSSLSPFTGNSITAQRISSFIGAHSCTLMDITTFTDASDLQSYIGQHNIGLVVGVHAFRAGRLLVGCPVPYTLVLAGTDVNVHLHHPEKHKVIKKAIEKSAAVVGFHEAQLQAIQFLQLEQVNHHCIPQAVTVQSPNTTDTLNPDWWTADDILLLLPAGLRPIKDVLFLVCAVEEWHCEDPRVKLVILGPQLDTEYAKQVVEEVDQLSAVVYGGPVDQAMLHQAMTAANFVINSSSHEGMCNSILEAMLLGTPVLARRNTGNESLLQHGVTGMLYTTPQQFVTMAKAVMQDQAHYTAMQTQARDYVDKHHSSEVERAAYDRVLAACLQ